MKVLLTLHHHFDPNLGGPGATLGLGGALEKAGCQVEYYGFEHAFGGDRPEGVRCMMGFPWKVASFLKRHGRDFDVVDASTGDSWVWARLGRPGAPPRHALVTRSHGLEHMLDRDVRQAHREGRRYSWKYPLYHGGYRLWEVEQSLKAADRCILLSEGDRAFARETLGISDDRLAVIPNGVAEMFHDLPPPTASADGVLRLTFVGTWIERKGIIALTEAVSRLSETGLKFEMCLLGTAGDPETITAAFSPAVRPHVRLIPRFQHQDLPGLLSGQDVLLFPSQAEGFGLALVEAMACGLAPVSTPVGIAPSVIVPEENGMIVPPNDAAALVSAVLALAADGAALLEMRRRAQHSVSAYRWNRIAAQTIAVYESIMSVEKM